MKKALLIIFVFASALCTVAALAKFSYTPNEMKNGFSRKFIVDKLILNISESFQEELRDVCGITDSHIYFSSATSGKIVVTDHNLKKTGIITAPVTQPASKTNPKFYQVKFPNVFVYEGNRPAITRYDANEEKQVTAILPKGAISQITAINNSTFIMRKIDVKLRDQRFYKYSITRNKLEQEHDISIPSKDIGLSTDGKLYYDQASNLLCYIHYYKNQFIAFDTNLNLTGRFNTIDTSNNTTFSSLTIGKTDSLVTNNKPVQMINKTGSVDKGRLYINSKLKADNESDKFEKNAAIDVYHLKTGKYAGSLYIPQQQGESLHRFRVYGDKIVAVYKHSAAVYTIQFK